MYNRQNNSYNKNKNQYQKVNLPNLVLDYKKDVNLFSDTAKQWADLISNGTKSTQIRIFYDYLLKLYEKSQIANNDFYEVLPFVKMLNSKVAYSKNRKLANNEFVEMVNKCVNQVNDAEDLKIFKLFFEAVVGFCKK